MGKRIFLLGMLSFVLVMLIQSGLAATVDGNAYKNGATDHSGITIDLEALSPVPTIGFVGIILLLAGITLIFLRNHRSSMLVPMLIFIVSGIMCLTYAAYFATTLTNVQGEYSFTDVEPGNYSIDASSPGYYPANIAFFTVTETTNQAPDMTLYPIPTFTPTITPIPTNTPTAPPTNTSIPTNTPTNTPTSTPTNIPTNTPTITPTSTITPTTAPTSTPTCGVGSGGGVLCATDNIVGSMRFVPSGCYIQGSPGTEPCRETSETQFEHRLTRDLAVMQTEVTRQMWSDLKGVQSDLPSDPTDTNYGSGMSNPVQNCIWAETILFSNLLSLENGYTRCYYADAGFTIPIDVTNYTTWSYYCDFDADGYRLPTEGEWEYFCRAGTTGAFSCSEPNYTSATCDNGFCLSGRYPTFETYAVFCANDSGTSATVGSKLSNPWNLQDLHGNVLEWCWDRAAVYPTSPQVDYAGADTGNYRIKRGGSWDLWASYCRSALRLSNYITDNDYSLGFRLVRRSL